VTAEGPLTARPAGGLLARGGLVRFAALAAIGAVAGLGQEPFGWWWLAVPAFALALHLAAGETRPRAAFADLWSLAFGHFAFTLNWLVEPFLVDAPRHGWMAPFALMFMAAGLGLFWGAAGLLARRAGGGALALALALTLAEVARALLFTGLPWALAGHVWIDTPLAQLAAVSGPHGLTLLTFALAAALAPPRATSALPLAAAAAAWLALDPGPAPPPDPAAPVIRLVQPAIPQDEKWDPALVPLHLDRILRLTAGPPGPDGTAAPAPALVVWPETALPWPLDRSADLLARAADAAGGAPLAIGIGRTEAGLFRNSLAVVDGQGAVLSVYDKHHLVPFGEYIPFGEWLKRFGIRGLAASDGAAFAPGPGPAVTDIPGLGTAMPLICYEGIFAEEVNAMPERADLLLLVTNDAWFGTNVGPYQHLAQARLRAIEQGLPMVRVANTGISAMIDPHGRILGRIALGDEGVLDLGLPAALPPTPYSRTGDWPVIILLFAALFLLGARSRRISG
jgi:apolipoprotein N-acyltransferase